MSTSRREKNGIILSVVSIVFLSVSSSQIYFQSFATFAQVSPEASSSEGSPAAGIVDRYPFSASYQKPASKQGVSEDRTSMSAVSFDRRYAKLKSMGTAYRQYNLWWSALEDSGIAGSAHPLSCRPGYQQIPAKEAERTAWGYHHYHCINQGVLATFDNLFRRDQQARMQSGVVLWSSPAIYRYAECVGFDSGGNNSKEGCVPRDDAMDDFEDYVNLLASRYNGKSFGKISHFIIWNENASPDWFDYSPVTTKTDLSSASVEKRIDKYAVMLKRAHAALLRHQKGSLMYASTDQLWDPGKLPGHFGTRWLLDGLWARLGVNYSWSVAVHPYGKVDEAPDPGTYTFHNLEMVVDYQVQKLRALGITDPLSYPQSLLIASEQGWPLTSAVGTAGTYGREDQARQMCLAHDKVMSMNQVVAVAHNYFHSTEPAENDANGQSEQGGFFGLIPYAVPDDLSGMESVATGKAFLSTMNAHNWKKRDDHYCCQIYGLGCRAANPSPVPSVTDAHQVMGKIDGISVINGQNTVSGWACVHAMDASIAVHLYMGGPAGSGHSVGVYSANLESESAVAHACEAGGAYRFQIPLAADTFSTYEGQPIYIYGISSLGLSSSALANSGNFRVPTRPHKLQGP